MTGELVWPNADSGANSDPWLIANHDHLRLMRPRVLAVNFVHGLSAREARGQAGRAVRGAARVLALAGVSRSAAPPFLDYQIVGIVDLTEPRGDARPQLGAASRAPRDGIGFDYGALHELVLHDGSSSIS